jgi:hypothetical protein
LVAGDDHGLGCTVAIDRVTFLDMGWDHCGRIGAGAHGGVCDVVGLGAGIVV